MKAFSILLLICFFYSDTYAQVQPVSPTLSKISSAAINKLTAYQDTLKEFAFYMNTDSLTEDRMVSDSQFTRTLVRALQVPYSFYFPFDSVKGISKLYAPDSSFRIITWNLQYNDYYNRQRGAIQLNTKNGSLKLFPLRDASEFTDHPEDSIRTSKNWVEIGRAHV